MGAAAGFRQGLVSQRFVKGLGRIVMGILAVVLDPVGIILWIVVGVVAGWLAGVVMKGSGYGVIGDLIIGLIGALVGGFVFSLFGAAYGGLLGSILVAFIGACILIAIVRFVSGGRSRI
jgi:uncharacterized membrane protein YeaQ/YmgE (transglycosylase-associated protein family)